MDNIIQSSWRQDVLKQLRAHKAVSDSLAPIFRSYFDLTDTVSDLKSQLLTARAHRDSDTSLTDNQQELADVKKQNISLKEELTELYRRRSENSQALLDANKKLAERDVEINRLKNEGRALSSRIEEYIKLTETLTEDVAEKQTTIDLLKTENIALDATFRSLEEKYRNTKEENYNLAERWKQQKQKEVEQLNLENERVVKQRESKLQRDISEAVSRFIPQFDSDKFELLDGPSSGCAGGNTLPSICVCSVVPTRALATFEAHDGDVLAVKYAPSGRFFATGGSDRRLKCWQIGSNARPNCISTFHGCNQSVMDIDFDQDSENILACSNDNVVRIWSVSQQRIRHTFTGHSNNVLSARYLRGAGGAMKVASGSRDKTLKFWDLRTDSCTSTKFPGSTCNDLATMEGSGASLVSAHHDKKLRFWDERQPREVDCVELPDKITSIRLSSDMRYILASCRDDALHFYDMRGQRIQRTFEADGLRLSYDHSRVALAPDDQFCAIGSNDGVVYVWSVLTGALEGALKAHHNVVMACTWDPSGRHLVSVDKEHKVVFWTE